MIMKMILRFVIVTVVFFAIDLVWLGLVAKDLYRRHLGFLMRDPVNWTAALIFYALFVVGLLYFVVNPALAEGSLAKAALAGALFGLVTYATYDLTNLATVKDWPLLITVVDLVWGTFVTAATSVIGTLVLQKLKW